MIFLLSLLNLPSHNLCVLHLFTLSTTINKFEFTAFVTTFKQLQAAVGSPLLVTETEDPSSKGIHLTVFDDYASPCMGSSLKAKTVPPEVPQRERLCACKLCVHEVLEWKAHSLPTCHLAKPPVQWRRGFLPNFCSDFFFWCYIDLKQGVSFTKSIRKPVNSPPHTCLHTHSPFVWSWHPLHFQPFGRIDQPAQLHQDRNMPILVITQKRSI